MFKFGKLPSAVIAIALTVAMLFSVAIPTLAYTASVGSVAEDIDGKEIVGQDVDQGKQTEYSDGIAVEDSAITENCDVYATVPDSDIVVTVPKVQILDGKSAAANVGVYTVAVRGDISATTVINVEPQDEMEDRDGVNFEMTSAGKAGIPTDVDQAKTMFTYASGVRPDTPATTTGTITAHGMTAGIWNGDFMFNISAGVNEDQLTTDEIVEKYDLKYYSALNLAVTDVNNDAIGENADVADLENAVAGVYTDEFNKVNVILLKDSVEDVRSTPAVNMTINLGGNTLSVNDAFAIEITDGDVTIDGRTEGSSIEMSYNDVGDYLINEEVKAGCIYNHGDNLTVLGGTYECDHSFETYNNVGIITESTMKIENANIVAHNEMSSPIGVYVIKDNDVFISDSSILVTACGPGSTFGIVTAATNKTLSLTNTSVNMSATPSGVSSSISVGVYGMNGAGLNISGCDIVASSSRINSTTTSPLYISVYGIGATGFTEISDSSIIAYGTGSYSSYGVNASSKSTLIINDCNIKGLHSGVASSGTLYINGGTYEGYAHGGIYFAGENSVNYTENAIIKQCNWFGEFSKPADGYWHNSAFYIGSKSNITVYMNNCELWTYIKGFTLRRNANQNESNNTLYISNSTIRSLYSNVYGEKGDTWIRIDNANPPHKLFIGKGCNFTADDINSSYGIITQTDEVYTRP